MIDIANFPPSYRVRLIRLGTRYGSDDVLAQGRYVAKHFKISSKDLVPYGYSSEHAAKLVWACDELSKSLKLRQKRRTNRRTTRADVATTEAEARLARRIGRTVLNSVAVKLLQDGKGDAANRIEIVLAETSRSPDADGLERQLEQIEGAFRDPEVVSVADDGCKHAHERVKQAVQEYADAHAGRPRRTGTPATTEYIDLLDGLIIENVRIAQRAASDAASDLGKPHLAETFRLYELEGRPRPAPSATKPNDAPGTELVPENVSDDPDATDEQEDVSNF